MSVVVFIDRLEPADSKRDAVLGLLGEFADSINADPEGLNYSFTSRSMRSRALDRHPAYESVAGFDEHGQWMEPNIPGLVAAKNASRAPSSEPLSRRPVSVTCTDRPLRDHPGQASATRTATRGKPRRRFSSPNPEGIQRDPDASPSAPLPAGPRRRP